MRGKMKQATKAELRQTLVELTTGLLLAIATIETERGHSWHRSKLAKGTERWMAEQQLKRLTRRIEFIGRELGFRPMPLPHEPNGAKLRAALAADLKTIRRGMAGK